MPGFSLDWNTEQLFPVLWDGPWRRSWYW